MSTTLWKELSLGIVTLGISVGVFLLWQSVIAPVAEGEFEAYANLIPAVVGLIFAAAAFLLLAAFITNVWMLYGFGLASIAIPFLFTSATSIVLAALVAGVLLGIFAIKRTKKELVQCFGFSISKVARAGLPLYFTAASLIVSMFYFAHFDTQNSIAILVPRPALRFILDTLPNSVGSSVGLPPITSGQSVDDFLTELVVTQLEGQGVEREAIPHDQLTGLIAQQREAFSEQFGISLKGSDKIQDALYLTMTQKIEEILGPYKRFLPIASVVAFFLAFRTLTWLLYYFSYFVVFLSVKILTVVKFLTRQTEEVEVEKLGIH